MSWLTDFEIISNVKPSVLKIEEIGIIFQDRRIAQSIGFGIALKDPKKEATIHRSHSLCPTKDHFIDKNSPERSLRYLSSPSLNLHISGAKYERGQRLELAQDLRNTKEKVENNQFHLNMLSARGDCRCEAGAILIGVEHKVTANQINGEYLAINKIKDVKNWEEVSALKCFNMDLHDYDQRPKEYLKFRNLNENSLFDFEKRASSPQFSRLHRKEEFERFPFQKIKEQPKLIRYNLGLPINSSISNSSTEDIRQSPRIPFTNSSGSLSDLENLFF
jgi:hypothetical protein